jgi:ABC-type hemin transport system substrate-binding protein
MSATLAVPLLLLLLLLLLAAAAAVAAAPAALLVFQRARVQAGGQTLAQVPTLAHLTGGYSTR